MPDLILSGPVGRLEARHLIAPAPRAPVALILHPDPTLGGTMNTKIVYQLYQLFSRCGFTVVRFNFRGVGRSQGTVGAGDDEVADAANVVDWIQAQSSEAERFWVVGFSFGAWVAMQLLMRRPEVDEFVAIAPPADKRDFTFLQPCPRGGLIVQGDRDQLADPSQVDAWAKALRKQSPPDVEIQYRLVQGADHFFSGHMERLTELVEAHIRMRLAPPDDAAVKRTKRRRERAAAKKAEAGHKLAAASSARKASAKKALAAAAAIETATATATATAATATAATPKATPKPAAKATPKTTPKPAAKATPKTTPKPAAKVAAKRSSPRPKPATGGKSAAKGGTRPRRTRSS